MPIDRPSAQLSARAAAGESSYQYLELLLDEAKAALIAFRPAQVDHLEAACNVLMAQGTSHPLTRAEAKMLASRCHTLGFLLRHANTNLSLLEKLFPLQKLAFRSSDSQTRAHRGYPWLR